MKLNVMEWNVKLVMECSVMECDGMKLNGMECDGV
jgi:hypothetical protein